jgi:hypothetical protein
MAGPPAVRWLLTVAFLLAGGYCGVRCVRLLRPGRRLDAAALVSDLTHLAMSAVMVAMVWSWTSTTAVQWEATLFGVAAGWYAVRWVALAPRRAGHPGGHPRLAYAHHALGMVAMVWMLTTMPLPGPAARTSPMPGMGVMPAAGVPGVSARNIVTALILGTYFAVAAIGWLVAARRARGGLGGTVHVVMSAAMGAALLALIPMN